MNRWQNMKNKKQLWLVIGGFLLIQIFYFGFDTVQLDREGSIGEDGSAISDHAWDDHLDDALSVLSTSDRDSVESWMARAEEKNIISLKQLASFWVSRSEWEIGGHYMDLIAETTNATEDLISAARTYATGTQQAGDEEHRTILREKALSLYDQAIDQETNAFDLELEKVLFLIKAPDNENPMLGVLSLVELSEKYPEEAEVFVHLGRFSIQTGQWDKAQERLERAYELDPENQETICLLSTVYKENGDAEQSNRFSQLCENK